MCGFSGHVVQWMGERECSHKKREKTHHPLLGTKIILEWRERERDDGDNEDILKGPKHDIWSHEVTNGWKHCQMVVNDVMCDSHYYGRVHKHCLL